MSNVEGFSRLAVIKSARAVLDGIPDSVNVSLFEGSLDPNFAWRSTATIEEISNEVRWGAQAVIYDNPGRLYGPDFLKTLNCIAFRTTLARWMDRYRVPLVLVERYGSEYIELSMSGVTGKVMHVAENPNIVSMRLGRSVWSNPLELWSSIELGWRMARDEVLQPTTNLSLI